MRPAHPWPPAADCSWLSESTRNVPDATTRSPAVRPRRIADAIADPLARRRPARLEVAVAEIDEDRLPSAGVEHGVGRHGEPLRLRRAPNSTFTYMSGFSRMPGFGASSRTFRRASSGPPAAGCSSPVAVERRLARRTGSVTYAAPPMLIDAMSRLEHVGHDPDAAQVHDRVEVAVGRRPSGSGRRCARCTKPPIGDADGDAADRLSGLRAPARSGRR